MGKRHRSSVQQHYVQAREILGEVLCLWAPLSPTKRVYRAVLEVSTLNFLLKAEEEQEALVERYRGLLKALTFPVQLLVRHERLDLGPYLARMQAHIPESGEAPGWAEVVAGLERLLRQVEAERTLIARHCYLIIPAPDPVRPTRAFHLGRPRRRVRNADLLARACQDLAVRVGMVQHQLTTLGLRSQRLGGEDLAHFYHRCLTPEHALQHPLQRVHLATVGHLPQGKRAPLERAPARQESDMPPPAPEETPPASPDGADEPALSQPVPPRRARKRKEGRAAPAQAEALPLPDVVRLADVLAPGSIEEAPGGLCIGDEWVRGIAVTAFPREVSMRGWLAPLLMYDECLEIVFHLHPQNQAAMLRQLKRRRTGYASTHLWDRRQGRLSDPDVDVAHRDVNRVMADLASGEERLFEVSLLVLVRASSRALLDERSERVMARLQAVLLDAVAHPTTFEHALAFRSALPEGRDVLRRTMTLETASIATTFPFLSNALTMPGGVYLGLTESGDLVLLNPWDASLENPHAFVGGITGSGKSYLGKAWFLRSLLFGGRSGERFSVIDPDGEYRKVARAVGGTIVRIAPGAEHHLNPFDLIPAGCDLETYLAEDRRLDRLAEKISDLHSLLDVLLAERGKTLSPREKALLDQALYETYRKVGISPDPRTHYHQPPLLRDLLEVLRSGVCGDDESDLGLRLSRYVEGSLAGLFSQQTDVPLDTHALVWDIFDMRGDLRPVGIFLIADRLWTQAIYQSQVRRCLLIDEAASLLEYPEGGRFLATLARRARKRYLRLVTMTQNPETFVEDSWGCVVASNAAIKLLKSQDRTSVQGVAQRFGLTAGEAQRLLTFGVHEALLIAGDRRVLLSLQASPQEHTLITTNPVELAAMAEAEAGQMSNGVGPESLAKEMLS